MPCSYPGQPGQRPSLSRRGCDSPFAGRRMYVAYCKSRAYLRSSIKLFRHKVRSLSPRHESLCCETWLLIRLSGERSKLRDGSRGSLTTDRDLLYLILPMARFSPSARSTMQHSVFMRHAQINPLCFAVRWQNWSCRLKSYALGIDGVDIALDILLSFPSFPIFPSQHEEA